MSFPTKAEVAKAKKAHVDASNLATIQRMTNIVMTGRTSGRTDTFAHDIDREALIRYFAENTEWKLSFYKQYENGDLPGDTEVEYWSLS